MSKTRIEGSMSLNDEKLPNHQDILNTFCAALLLHTPCFNVSAVSYQDVRTALKKLKKKATAGTDMVPSSMVKDYSCVFDDLLQFLYNPIYKTATFPS